MSNRRMRETLDYDKKITQYQEYRPNDLLPVILCGKCDYRLDIVLITPKMWSLGPVVQPYITVAPCRRCFGDADAARAIREANLRDHSGSYHGPLPQVRRRVNRRAGKEC